MSTRTLINSPFVWLIRRELWEHRLIQRGPLLLLAVIGISALASLLNPHHTILNIDTSDWMMNDEPIELRMVFAVAAAISILSMVFLVLAASQQVFYCADALHSERMQRTILFWKSLPVGDTETVLSKLVVATFVIPLFALAAAFATALILALVASVEFRALPGALAALWSPGAWLNAARMMVYVTVTGALWLVPVNAWFLLVSAWLPLTRGRLGRSPLLAATALPLLAMLVEKIVLGTNHIMNLVSGRVAFAGYEHAAFASPFRLDSDADLHGRQLGEVVSAVMTPGGFLFSSGLWAGLAFGALCAAGAIYCRRRSEDRG